MRKSISHSERTNFDHTCSFAAWAGSLAPLSYICDGQPKASFLIDPARPVRTPQFRLNRDRVVLNDTSDGRIVDPTNRQRLDDWRRDEDSSGTVENQSTQK